MTVYSFKLVIETQDNKGKEICNNIVFRNSSKTAALKKIEYFACTGEAKNLIINKAIAQKNELEEFYIQESERRHSPFLTRQRKNSNLKALQEVLCVYQDLDYSMQSFQLFFNN